MTLSMAYDLVGEENIVIFYDEDGIGWFYIIGSSEKYLLTQW